MSFEVVCECGVCGTELDRSKKGFKSREDAQAAANEADKVSMLWAPRCPKPNLHSGPYADTNMAARLRVIELNKEAS